MSDAIWVAIITGGVALITGLVNRFGGQKRAIDKIAEGLKISLENDKVMFDAFRRNAINGESEKQEAKMAQYFMDSTTSGYRRK